eukprot:s1905_g6.t1
MGGCLASCFRQEAFMAWAEAEALFGLAQMQDDHKPGDDLPESFKKACDAAEEALKLAKAVDDDILVMHSQQVVAKTRIMSFRHWEAEEPVQEALEIAQKNSQRCSAARSMEEASLFLLKAQIHICNGEDDKAQEVAKTARTLFEELGSEQGEQAREIIDGDYLRQREQEETGVTAATPMPMMPSESQMYGSGGIGGRSGGPMPMGGGAPPPQPMAAAPSAAAPAPPAKGGPTLEQATGQENATTRTRPKRLKRAPQSPWEIVDDHDQIVDDHDQEEQQCVHPDHDMHTRLVLTPGCADSGDNNMDWDTARRREDGIWGRVLGLEGDDPMLQRLRMSTQRRLERREQLLRQPYRRNLERAEGGGLEPSSPSGVGSASGATVGIRGSLTATSASEAARPRLRPSLAPHLLPRATPDAPGDHAGRSHPPRPACHDPGLGAGPGADPAGDIGNDAVTLPVPVVDDRGMSEGEGEDEECPDSPPDPEDEHQETE